MKKSLVVIGISLLLGACKTEGCTDPLGENYNSEAEKDDHSCVYHSNFVFYFDYAKAIYYNNIEGIYPPMRVVINGESAGEANWWVQTYEEAPGCNELLGTVNYLHKMKNKEEEVLISIEDFNGQVYDTKNITVKVGNCTAVLF